MYLFPSFPKLSGRPRKYLCVRKDETCQGRETARGASSSLQTGSHDYGPWQRMFWLIPVTSKSHLLQEMSVSQRETKRVKARLLSRGPSRGCQGRLATVLADGLAWASQCWSGTMDTRCRGKCWTFCSYIHSKGRIPFSSLGYQACGLAFLTRLELLARCAILSALVSLHPWH